MPPGLTSFNGDIYQKTNGRMVNLSEQERSDSRKALIDGLDEGANGGLCAAASKRKTTITVFTDIDCGYCRKLHQEVPELNRLGLRSDIWLILAPASTRPVTIKSSRPGALRIKRKR